MSAVAKKVEAAAKSLPEGWRRVPLGDLVNPNRPRIKPADKPELPFIGMEHIESNTMTLLGTVPASTMKSNAVHFQPGDVLYGRLRPYLNKVFRPTFEGLCSAEFIVMPENDEINGKYLQYFLNSTAFVFFASHLKEGDRPRVDFKILSPYEVPIPPTKDDQDRIVAEIEKQFSRLDEAVASLQRVKSNLKRHKAAVLKAAVEGKLTEEWRKQNPDVEPASKLLERILAERRVKWEEAELAKMGAKGKAGSSKGKKYKAPVVTDASAQACLPDGWQWISADSVSILITDGKHGDCKDVDGSGYFFLSAKDVKGGKLVYEGAREINRQEFTEVHQRTNLELGDVLITNAGTIGRIAVATDSDRVAHTTFQKSVAVIKPLRTFILSEYFALFLEAHVQQMKAKSAGTAVKNLLLRDLRAAPVALPPASEQIRLVMEVDSLLSVSDELEVEVEKSLIRASRLKQAILAWQFSACGA